MGRKKKIKVTESQSPPKKIEIDQNGLNDEAESGQGSSEPQSVPPDTRRGEGSSFNNSTSNQTRFNYRYSSRSSSTSSQDDDEEVYNNTRDMMPIDIQQMILGDVTHVTINQEYDYPDDIDMDNEVACDIVIESVPEIADDDDIEVYETEIYTTVQKIEVVPQEKIIEEAVIENSADSQLNKMVTVDFYHSNKTASVDSGSTDNRLVQNSTQEQTLIEAPVIKQNNVDSIDIKKDEFSVGSKNAENLEPDSKTQSGHETINSNVNRLEETESRLVGTLNKISLTSTSSPEPVTKTTELSTKTKSPDQCMESEPSEPLVNKKSEFTTDAKPSKSLVKDTPLEISVVSSDICIGTDGLQKSFPEELKVAVEEHMIISEPEKSSNQTYSPSIETPSVEAAVENKSHPIPRHPKKNAVSLTSPKKLQVDSPKKPVLAGIESKKSPVTATEAPKNLVTHPPETPKKSNLNRRMSDASKKGSAADNSKKSLEAPLATVPETPKSVTPIPGTPKKLYASKKNLETNKKVAATDNNKKSTDPVKKQLSPPKEVPSEDAKNVNGEKVKSNKKLPQPAKSETVEEKKEAAKKPEPITGSTRRRSNRIRVNRWEDITPAEIVPHSIPTPIVPAPASTPPPPPPPPPLSSYESDKPVKVKSRWRRTSELEMGTNTTSDSDQSVSTFSVRSPQTSPCPSESPVKLPLITVHPEIDERLKSFEIITHNLFLGVRTKSKEAKRMICDCTLSKEEIARGEKGCGDDCLNRLLMIECGSRCGLGSLCSNKRFQNCEYIKCDVVKTAKKGLGIVSALDIESGCFLMEYVGEVIDPKEFRRRAKEYSKEKNRHFYFMALKSDTIIDATQKGNISRFINHSCDPNTETQKWTVNGELRIGFFSKRAIAKGEEITFDYQLQRYGKEAQRCYCESSNCRGWIGEDPEKDRDDKDKNWNKKERKEKKRKEEKRRDMREFLNEMDLEEEIEKLSASGVKNQAHTLEMNRLMIRAEDHASRSQLLTIAQNADQRCLRLFLDYSGLAILWSWMVDNESPAKYKLEILKTLAVLPITNKTILKDSKILSTVQKWANQEDSSSDKKEKPGEDSTEGSPESEETVTQGENNTIPATPVQNSEEDSLAIVDQAKALLESWSDLKEDFRIPKKERIEQRKEHEREADRGYYNDPRENQSYDSRGGIGYRQWAHDREGRYKDKDKRRGRDSPDTGWRSPKDRNGALAGGIKLSKSQRRYLFAKKVEEEERQKKKFEEMWTKHQEQCAALGLDPNQTPMFNQINGFPGFYHPQSGTWQQLPPEAAMEGAEMQPMFGPPLGSGPPPMMSPGFPPPPGSGGFIPPGMGGPPPGMGGPQVMGAPPGAVIGMPPPGMPPNMGPPGGTMPPGMGPPPQSLGPPNMGMNGGSGGPMMGPPGGPPLGPPLPGGPGMEHFQGPPPGANLPPGGPNMGPPPGGPGMGPPMNMGPPPGMGPPMNMVPVPGPFAAPPPGAPFHQGPPPFSQPPPPLQQFTTPPPLSFPTPPPTQPPSKPQQAVFPFIQQPLPNLDSIQLPPPVTAIVTSTQSVVVDHQPPLPPNNIPPPPPRKLPPKWKSAKDPEGRVYFYHKTLRKSQWQFPTPEQQAEADALVTSVVTEEESESEEDDSYSEDEEESSSEEEDEEKFEEEEEEEDMSMVSIEAKRKAEEDAAVDQQLEFQTLVTSPEGDYSPTQAMTQEFEPALKKRRDGLVQVNIISPRNDELNYRKGIKKSKIRETKDKLARAKHKQRSRSSRKAKSCEADSSGPSRRIKDKFRVEMANVIVSLLNPYRKADCKIGRIQNTEDFKHLARKLTHFVMVKELKHTSIEELECNDNVKHKARDFIRKYMSKFGAVYIRITDD